MTGPAPTWREVQAAKDSAPCRDCLDVAFASIGNDVEPDDARAWIMAREWLFDRGAVAACLAHEARVEA